MEVKDKVVIEIGGRHSNRLIRYHNPLGLDQPKNEWISSPTLSGSNVINPDNVIETNNNRQRWYTNIPEPGKNPYGNQGQNRYLLGVAGKMDSHREGEYFGNYMKVLSELVRCPVPYDRTGEFNWYNYLIDPIPKVPQGWNRTFEEVILERAEEIWKLDKPVRMWWSGGIDSTTALVSFLRTKKPEHELIVYMADACVDENPNMYDRLKNMDDVKIQWNDSSNIWRFDNWSDGSINITGEPGDPLYGTFVVEDHIEEINAHWTDVFKWEDSCYMYREDDYRLDYHRPKFMEFAEEYNKKCPFEIKNTFDFTWWLAFTIKWQWIVNRLYLQLENPSRWDNMLSFYNFPEIQRWSIVNHDLKHRGTWKTYKWPSKEFIYNYNKDTNYRDNKVKEKSFPKTVSMVNSTAPNHMLMSSGKFYKKILKQSDGVNGLDPQIIHVDKWDIFNKPVWTKWQKML